MGGSSSKPKENFCRFGGIFFVPIAVGCAIDEAVNKKSISADGHGSAIDVGAGDG